VDGTTTTYVYDYANRLIAPGVGGATTTFAYDAFEARVSQTLLATTRMVWYILGSLKPSTDPVEGFWLSMRRNPMQHPELMRRCGIVRRHRHTVV
jgi:hypothetical protein